jgi:nucleotide-binding universal stress UspA family protein
MPFQRILVPTDFSDLSQVALRYAAEMAHSNGGQLFILHAVDTLGPENVTYGEAVSQPQPEEAYRRRLWEDIHQVKSPLPDVPVHYLLSELDTAAAVVQAAAQQHCDLIVIGSHGRTGLKRLLMGSVAEEVVRKAPCPVLVVKAPKEPPATPPVGGSEFHPRQLTEKQP